MIGLRKEWNRKQYLLQKSFFAYSLFTAAQFLRRWFSALTQTVTQTRKKSGGIIRTGKDAAVEIFEWKGAEMPRNVHQKYPTNLRDQEASGSNPDTPTILTKRYRCVWRKVRRINRFRAFSSPDFFSQTIDANRCFRASAPIRTGCFPVSCRCVQPAPFFSGDFSGWQRYFSQKRITKIWALFCWS